MQVRGRIDDRWKHTLLLLLHDHCLRLLLGIVRCRRIGYMMVVMSWLLLKVLLLLGRHLLLLLILESLLLHVLTSAKRG